MEMMIYKAVIDPAADSELEVSCMGLVDKPAIERNFQAFKADQVKQLKFSIDEEKRIIQGPAMIADLPIYRNDPKLGEYFVLFDKDAIQSIVEKFAGKGYMKNFNLFHDEQQAVDDVTIFNSFVSNKAQGIAPIAGFEDCADGSWFISAKVNNEAVWQKVKAGEIRGFSVEGIFSYIPVAKAAMQQADKYTALLEENIMLRKKLEALDQLLNETLSED